MRRLIEIGPLTAGLLAASSSVALGCIYMALAGAPPRLLLMNGAALLIGLAAVMLLRAAQRTRLHGADGIFVGLSLTLLATALTGQVVDGAARWVTVGNVTVQPSLILIPPILVAFARRQTFWSGIAISISAIAMALQPDRAMAGMLFAGTVVVAAVERTRWTGSLAAFSLAAFAGALMLPDRLPAMPFVDQIYYTSFDVHPVAGVAVVLGSVLLFAPLLTLRGEPRSPALLAFGAAWFAAVAAAALGNYPTPLVGYGGSAILGYLLSVGVLHPDRTSAHEAPLNKSAGMPQANGDDLHNLRFT